VKAGAVIEELERLATRKTLDGMTRFGIPNERALGVTMGDMRRLAEGIGSDHELALELWKSGCYEARTVAVFVDDPTQVSRSQMNAWARDFDSWAICDTTCLHLFDRTPHAWSRIRRWAPARREFVRRAAFALIWALSVHDKSATDGQFEEALTLIERHGNDERPLVKKAVDMALRAVGKRNRALNRKSIRVAKRLQKAEDRSLVWIGKHALKELESAKVQQRVAHR